MRRSTMLHTPGCALIAAVTFAALPAMAQEKKPNVVFILADNVGYGDLVPTVAASCAARRRRASTSSPARACASRSIWSSPAAHPRARH